MLLASLLIPLHSAPPGSRPLPKLKMVGQRMVDPSGKAVRLRGANLGNWHVIEFWMLALAGKPGAPKDQYALEELLTRRFGEAEKDRLMGIYRDSWITARDFPLMKSFDFNLLRLPMNYRTFEDDRKPFVLKKDAWRWIDRAVDLSERNGMYVILDMHGVQGGQSPYDHTGRSDQNRLKDSPEDQKRLAWLWGEIAKRYRNRSAVVAYDVFNEPYGTPKPIQVEVFKRALREIRKNDPDKLVFAMGNFDDFDHYGDPKANGWRNVGFQMHYYPGLFGGGDPTIKTQRRHLSRLPALDARLKKLNVPFLVGEMNVVFDRAGGADMMRRTYDAHESYGWMTTMWSYKVMGDSGGFGDASWGAVSNARPMVKVDFATASKAEIAAWMRQFATMPLAVNEPLRRALGDRSYRPAPLPEVSVRTTAPQGSWNGWKTTDVGGARQGGLEVAPNSVVDLYGGGSDVWGTRDQFRFLHQEQEGDGVIEATIKGIEDIDTYTKAGLMLRATTETDSPLVMFTVTPSGEAQFSSRARSGETILALPTQAVKVPGVRLRLIRKGGQVSAFYMNDGNWKSMGSLPDPLPKRALTGLIALSHDDGQLVKVSYEGISVRPGG